MAKITPLPKTPNVDGSVSKSLWDWLIKIGLAVNQLIGWSNNIKPADVGAAPAAAGVPAGGTAGQVLGKTGSADYAMGWTTPAVTPTGVRNRIINGGFLINQRNFVSGTGLSAGTYAHDRWKAGSSGCTYTFIQSGGPKNNITIAAGSLQQVIEGINIEGGSYVLSWAGTAQGRINGGAYGASPLTVSGIAVGSNVTVEFNTGTVSAVQFEAGSIATPFEIDNYSDQLRKCKRYYQAFYFRIDGWASDGNIRVNSILFDNMRAAPTVSFTVISVYPTQASGYPTVTATNPSNLLVTIAPAVYPNLTTVQGNVTLTSEL